MAKHCQPLIDYVNRINAEQVNFRTWQVKEYKGKYYFEKAIIRVGPEGDVEAPPDYAPTKAEQERIKQRWNESEVPHSTRVKDLRPGMIKKTTPKSVFYEFYDDEGWLTFVQERCDPKAYLPWSYWSDGVWRQMSPDGAVPFWMPKQRVIKGKIMIHEGAKAAKAAGEMDEDHPWYDDFKDYEHWGLVGGSMSVRRADYKYLRKRLAETQITDVVYVCDNDWPGRNVLQEFSKYYGGKLAGTSFDMRFPSSFDMADPMPKEFFNKKRYIGPPFIEFRKAATFATEKIKQDKGPDKTIIRKTFLEEWMHVVRPEVFIHKEWPAEMYTLKEFNSKVRPYSDADDTARLVLTDDAGKGMLLKYDPSKPSGPFASEEGYGINTYQPSRIKAGPGSTKPWLDFMKHLIPDEHDRHEVERWLATLIAHPSVKILYGLLLISETQGVGKGTLAEKVMKPLIGEMNCSAPREKDIVDSNWNYWCSHKRLAIVHEIYSGHSWKAYNDLKSIITDKDIEVHRKFLADYRIDNWIHIIAMSNSMGAIKLSYDDRRWLVPRVTEEKQPAKYWTDFNHWVTHEGGLNIIRRWAEEFPDVVHHGAEAPSTSIKREIVVDSLGEAQQFIYDLLNALDEWSKLNDKGVIISDVALVEIVKEVKYEGKTNDRLSPLMFRKVAKSLGWQISRDRVKLKGTLSLARLLCNRPGDLDNVAGLLDKGYQMFGKVELAKFHSGAEHM
jgi:hypothetical protein